MDLIFLFFFPPFNHSPSVCHFATPLVRKPRARFALKLFANNLTEEMRNSQLWSHVAPSHFIQICIVVIRVMLSKHLPLNRLQNAFALPIGFLFQSEGKAEGRSQRKSN